MFTLVGSLYFLWSNWLTDSLLGKKLTFSKLMVAYVKIIVLIFKTGNINFSKMCTGKAAGL